VPRFRRAHLLADGIPPPPQLPADELEEREDLRVRGELQPELEDPVHALPMRPDGGLLHAE